MMEICDDPLLDWQEAFVFGVVLLLRLSQFITRSALTIPELYLFRMCSDRLPEQLIRAMPVRSAETKHLQILSGPRRCW